MEGRPAFLRQRGTVSIEVLMALLPLLFTFLGITQLALLQIGQHVVQHAAGRAVRSAVVVLSDDPKHYGGAQRYDLHGGGATESRGIEGFFADANNAYSQLLGHGDVQGGARLTAIRQAAYHPLAVLSPPESALSRTLAVVGTASARGTTLHEEVGTSPWLRVTAVAAVYNRGATSLQLETADGGDVASAGPRTPIKVKLNYLMACGVPLVSRFMCTRGREVMKAGLGLSASTHASNIHGALTHVASPALRDLLLASGGSYRLLSAEATLPNQGAEYH